MRPFFPEAILVAICLLAKPSFSPAQPAQPESAPVRVSALPNIDFGPHFVDLSVVQKEHIKGRAFGDPASGCYSAVFRVSLPTSASIEKITQGAVASLRANEFEVASIVHANPDYNAATSFSLQKQSTQGLATLLLEQNGPRQAELLACYWNERSPLHCAALCEDALKAHARGTTL